MNPFSQANSESGHLFRALLKFLTPLLGVLFLVLLFISLRTMSDSRVAVSGRTKSAEKLSYQYAFFLPESDNSYFSSLKAGATAAAKELNCAVIFHTLTPNSLSLEMASYGGSNGVAVFSYEKDDATVRSLTRMVKQGVPVVQIENEVVSRPETVLIGTNGYDTGKAIGKVALSLEKSGLDIALIYSDKNPSVKADANLVEIGIRSTLGERLSALRTGKTTFNPLDAEGVIYELLRRLPSSDNGPTGDRGMDVIALTDPSDTLVAIQAIIDLNLVGKVQIIGFGDDQTIRDYIDEGVVLGTIARRPAEIGFRAVSALTEINAHGKTSAYVNTGIDIRTRASTSSQRSE